MNRLQSFIESVFDESFDTVANVKSFRELDDWDSLKYLKLIVAIQAKFDVELTPDEIQKVISVQAINDVLQSRGVAL
jgi:acyl carrier protein